MNMKYKSNLSASTAHLYIWGEFFGYPECCIEEFTLLIQKPGFSNHPMCGTGFVPCISCREATKKMKVGEARKHFGLPTPRPRGTINSMKKTEKFIKISKNIIEELKRGEIKRWKW